MSRDGVHTGLTDAVLSTFLERLHADPERAADAYERLRATLIRFFDWRGMHAPEDLADVVLDRLARRLSEDADIQDPRKYALAIARHVLLEQLRSPARRVTPLDETCLATLAAPRDEAAETPFLACFERCLATLPDDSRSLIVRYYSHDRGQQIPARARLAAELSLSASALRSRAQRVRDRLESCIRECSRRAEDPGYEGTPTT